MPGTKKRPWRKRWKHTAEVICPNLGKPMPINIDPRFALAAWKYAKKVIGDGY